MLYIHNDIVDIGNDVDHIDSDISLLDIFWIRSHLYDRAATCNVCKQIAYSNREFQCNINPAEYMYASLYRNL